MAALRQMHSSAWAVAAGIAFAAARAAAAEPEADARMALDWGLIGTWAIDCSKPASRQNVYLTYEVAGPKVVHRRDFGDGQDSNTVTNLKLLDDGIEVELYFANFNPPQTRFFEIVKDGNRTHTKYNHASDGSYSVKDFIFVGSGAPVPWNEKCR